MLYFLVWNVCSLTERPKSSGIQGTSDDSVSLPFLLLAIELKQRVCLALNCSDKQFHSCVQYFCCSPYKLPTPPPTNFNGYILNRLSLRISQRLWTSHHLSALSVFISEMTGLDWEGSASRSVQPWKLARHAGKRTDLLSPVCFHLWNPLKFSLTPENLLCSLCIPFQSKKKGKGLKEKFMLSKNRVFFLFLKMRRIWEGSLWRELWVHWKEAPC